MFYIASSSQDYDIHPREGWWGLFSTVILECEPVAKIRSYPSGVWQINDCAHSPYPAQF